MSEEKTTQKSGSKVNFLLGFFAGLALVSVIGFLILLGVMFRGKQEVDLGAQAGDTVAQEETQEAQEAEPVRELAADDHYKGDPNASIQFIIYDDFECPYCYNHEATLAQIEAEYPDDVVIVYRHFPLSFHANAQKAAEASECAAEQGKFWEMHDMLFEAAGTGELGIDKFKQIAASLGLDTAQFNQCLDSAKYEQEVQKDLADGLRFGVQGTPGNFVNGILISGAYPFEQFQSIFEQILAQ